MGGRKEEKGSGCRALTSPAKILHTDSPFRISGLRFRVKLQKAPLELMWVILFFFLGVGGEGGLWGVAGITEMIPPFILALNRAPSSLPKPC